MGVVIYLHLRSADLVAPLEGSCVTTIKEIRSKFT